jgi:hypothetical protein
MSTNTLIDVPLVFPDDTPRARRGDPVESHNAADTSDVAGSRREVLSWLTFHPEGLTDHQLEELHVRSRRAAGHAPYTGARLRTARAELVEHGRVLEAGKGVSPSGRPARIWAIA